MAMIKPALKVGRLLWPEVRSGHRTRGTFSHLNSRNQTESELVLGNKIDSLIGSIWSGS
jgi:hypothetical protein